MSKVIRNAHCTQISREIKAAYDDGKRIVVLNAPTGSQKSGVAWFSHLELDCSAAVLSHQKVLQDQYIDLLYTGNSNDFSTIKGRENYKCLVRRNTNAAMAPCAVLSSFVCEKKNDSTCPYIKAKLDAKRTNFLNSNYQYMWSMADAQPEFSFSKSLYIYDESHSIHQLYTDFKSPKLTQKDLKFYKKQHELADELDIQELRYLSKKLIDEIKNLKTIIENSQSDSKLKSSIIEIFNLKAENLLSLQNYIRSNERMLNETGKILNFSMLNKFESLTSGVFNNLKAIKPEFEDCIVESTKKANDDFSATITAFDIGKSFSSYSEIFSDKLLFMSATILGYKKFLSNLGFTDKEAHFIDLPSKFPIENRKIYLMPGISINYNVITKQPEKLQDTLEFTRDVVLDKAKNGESGIIFTSSYDLTKLVSTYFQMNTPPNTVDILFNEDSTTRTDVLEAFKLKGDKPKLLISCSFFEGVNLNADISRYSIIFKVPYKSLSSKYWKYILENDNLYYKLDAATALIQACGRSVRSEDDWADTFIVDGNARNLFRQLKNDLPEWFKESLVYV